MKKIFLIVVMVLCFISTAYAGRQIELTQLQGVRMIAVFGEDASVYIDAQNIRYYPLVLSFGAQATDGLINLNINKNLVIGQSRETPYTPQETYTFLKDNLGQNIADQLKALYLDGISEDISK